MDSGKRTSFGGPILILLMVLPSFAAYKLKLTLVTSHSLGQNVERYICLGKENGPWYVSMEACRCPIPALFVQNQVRTRQCVTLRAYIEYLGPYVFLLRQ